MLSVICYLYRLSPAGWLLPFLLPSPSVSSSRARCSPRPRNDCTPSSLDMDDAFDDCRLAAPNNNSRCPVEVFKTMIFFPRGRTVLLFGRWGPRRVASQSNRTVRMDTHRPCLRNAAPEPKRQDRPDHAHNSGHHHLDKAPKSYGLRSAWAGLTSVAPEAGDIFWNAPHFEGTRWWYPVGLLLLSPDLQRDAVAHGTSGSSHARPRFGQLLCSLTHHHHHRRHH
jgi:hypothetical protein